MFQCWKYCTLLVSGALLCNFVLVLLRLTYVVCQWYENAPLVERGGLNPSTPWIRYWCQHILLHLNAILLSFAICGKPVFDGDIQIWCFTFDNCWCFALQSHPRMLTSSVKTYEVIISFIFLLCCVTITFKKDFECFTASWNYIFIWESFSSIISTKRLSSWIINH